MQNKLAEKLSSLFIFTISEKINYCTIKFILLFKYQNFLKFSSCNWQSENAKNFFRTTSKIYYWNLWTWIIKLFCVLLSFFFIYLFQLYSVLLFQINGLNICHLNFPYSLLKIRLIFLKTASKIGFDQKQP